MRHFDGIIDLAAGRKGGIEALERILATTPVRPAWEIAAMPDDRILAEMCRYIFYAGFSPRVVQNKWPGFEAAFENFDVPLNAAIHPERFDALMMDPGIVRNGRKMRAVEANARLLQDLASSHGSAARFFAEWPDRQYTALLGYLKQHRSYLGGHAAMRFLRAIGKPAFVTTQDVVTALIREQVVTRMPVHSDELAAVQDAFNLWSEQSGRNLTEISRILAISVDDGHQPPNRRRQYPRRGPM